jgi:hypothetical protein
MTSFFDVMFRLGYSDDLHNHLKGLNKECDDFTATSVYALVFYVLLGSGFLIMLNYYRGLFHRPGFTGRRVWLFHLLTAAGIVFIVAWVKTLSDLNTGNFCSDLRFNGSDCLLFALTCALYSLLFTVLLSLLLKFFSIHHKRIPF